MFGGILRKSPLQLNACKFSVVVAQSCCFHLRENLAGLLSTCFA